MNSPIVLDLCCGRGGWSAGFLAEGWRAIGVDVAEQPHYPGDFFLQADIRETEKIARLLRVTEPIAAIVASPPCEEFSRHHMPWTRKRNPPAPDLSKTKACGWLRDWLEHRQGKRVPHVLENVQAAERWFGPAQAHYGPYYLWGDVPPLMPTGRPPKKETCTGENRARRARIPFELARHVAQFLHPQERTHR